MTLYSQKRAFFLDSFVEIIRDELNSLKSFVRGSGRELAEVELKRLHSSMEAVEYLSSACGLTEIAKSCILGRYLEHDIRVSQCYLNEQQGSILGILINKIEEMLTRQWLSGQAAVELFEKGDLKDIRLYYKKKYPELKYLQARKVSFSKDGDNFGVDLPTIIFQQVDDRSFFSMVLIDYSLYEESYQHIINVINAIEKTNSLVLHGPIDVKEDHIISRNAGLPYYLVIKSDQPAIEYLKDQGVNAILLKSFGIPRGYQNISSQSKISIREQFQNNSSKGDSKEPKKAVIPVVIPSVLATGDGAVGSLSDEALDQFRVILNSSVRDTVKMEIEKLVYKANNELEHRINSSMSSELETYMEKTHKKSRKERKLEQTGGRKVPISIATKIIAIVSLILMLAIISVALISSQQFSHKLRDATNAVNHSNTTEINSILTHRLDAQIKAISILNLPSLKNNNSDDQAFLTMFWLDHPDLLYMSVVGQNIAQHNNMAYSRFSLNNEIFESVIDEKINVINLSSKSSENVEVLNVSNMININRAVMMISYPLRVGSDFYPLVIFLDISAEGSLMDLVQVGEIEGSDHMLQTDKMIYIVNKNGDVLAHSDLLEVLKAPNYAHVDIVSQLIDNPSSSFFQRDFTDEEGVVWIGSAAHNSFAHLAVVVQIPEDEALAIVHRIIKIIIWITLIILSISILFIQFFSNSIVNPLRRLVGAAKKIEDGDYDIKLKSRTHDEVGVLTESFIDMSRGLAERERLKNSFGKFVNKDIAEMAMKGEIKLGGEIKKASIFFSDIRSFTAISEKLEPDEVVEFLNEYMTRMVECVNETNGNVDKYIGDAIMAVWGTPISSDQDTQNCVNGALLMRHALKEFNQGRGGDKKPIIKIGCGINTGEVLAGQIGSSDKMEYTVIGDAVNLASRIESLNKPMGTDILISADTYEEVKEIFDVVPMNKIKVKGKSEIQKIYAVLGRLDDLSRPKNLSQLRSLVGITGDFRNTHEIDLDKSEDKFKIME